MGSSLYAQTDVILLAASPIAFGFATVSLSQRCNHSSTSAWSPVHPSAIFGGITGTDDAQSPIIGHNGHPSRAQAFRAIYVYSQKMFFDIMQVTLLLCAITCQAVASAVAGRLRL